MADEAATKYAWQRGSPKMRRQLMNQRREELLAVDMATDRKAQEEWIALLMERQTGQEELLEDGADLDAPQEGGGPPPLRGWLWKQGNSGIIRSFRMRWFEYVDASGRLYYYRNREDEEPKGFVNLAEMTSITTTDPEGKKFQLITPDRTWVLLAEDEQTMITWMDELHYRKSLIPRQAEDGSGFISEQTATAPGSSDEEEAFPASKSGPKRESKASDFQLDLASAMADPALAEMSGCADFGIGVEEEEVTAVVPSSTSSISKESEANQKQAAEISAKYRDLEEECSGLRKQNASLRRDLRLKSESIALMQGELIAGEREAALKDQALRHLRTRLQEEEEAREKQLRHGLSAQELQARLVWSQSELAHTRALLDLFNQRIAGAMEQIAYFKAVADGAGGVRDAREAVWLSQLASAQQACAASEARNESIQDEVEQLRGQLRQLH